MIWLFAGNINRVCGVFLWWMQNEVLCHNFTVNFEQSRISIKLSINKGYNSFT